MNKQSKSSSVKRTILIEEVKSEEIINAMDENENFITSNLNDLSEIEEECSAGNPVADLVPKLKDLHLAQKSKSVDHREQLAGYVKAVIPASGTVVVGLAADGKLLDVGTAIFALTDEEAPQEIGSIADIFGNVCEPMYSLQLKEKADGDTLKIDTEVFYLRDHPSTGYISVKRETNNRYTVVRNTESF